MSTNRSATVRVPGAPPARSSSPQGRPAGASFARRTLSAALLAVAQITGSALALQASHAIQGTPEDILVPRFFECAAALPEHASDGRKVPFTLAKQIENVLRALRRRGKLPSHPGVRFRTLKNALMALASFDYGDGVWVSEEEWKARADICERHLRTIVTWAQKVGWLHKFSRSCTTDRICDEEGKPETQYRSNVYMLYICPLDIAAELSDDGLIDLIALGKPRTKLQPREDVGSASAGDGEAHRCDAAADACGGAPIVAPCPRPAARDEAPPQCEEVEGVGGSTSVGPRRQDPSVSPNATHLGALAEPLEQLAQITGLQKSPAWFNSVAAAANLKGRAVVETLLEAAEKLRIELAMVVADGLAPEPWTEKRLESFLAGCLARKSRELASGPGRRRARTEIAEREAKHEETKEQEREDDLAAFERRRLAAASLIREQAVPEDTESEPQPEAEGETDAPPARTIVETRLISKLRLELANFDGLLTAARKAEIWQVLERLGESIGPPE